MHTLRLLWAASNEETQRRRENRAGRRIDVIGKITVMSESEFITNFRLNKNSFWHLCADLKRYTNIKSTREITLETKVLCTLSFLATGSYQKIVGLNHHLVQRSTSRCIKEVVEALNHPQIVKKWIKFPATLQERSQIRLEFQRKFQLPGVVGCIDCTHVAIIRPNDNEHLYFNRKGYHSLNVQMVCDSRLKILNVNSKFGGASHDSFIWASSLMEAFMRQLHQNGEQAWLLGDSGYPQRPWLMTPILNASAGSREDVYTQRHIQARNCIERCFGLLKARWRCLLKHRTLHYHPVVAGKMVLACSVLHNIALDANLPDIFPEHVNEEENIIIPNEYQQINNELLQGRAVLSSLLARL